MCNNKKKILLVSPCGYGGIQSLCLDLSISFHRFGFHVTILWQRPTIENVKILQTPDYISTIEFCTSPKFNQYVIFNKLKKIIADYDIVYPNTSGITYKALASHGKKRPVVIAACYSNTNHDYFNLVEFQDFYDKCILSNKVQFAYMDSSVAFKNKVKYKIIRHGVNSTKEPIKKKALDPVKLLFVGRQDNNKRPLHALTLLQKLLQSGINTELTYIGDGALSKDIDHAIKTNNLFNKVKKLKNVSQILVDNEYKKSHYLIFPSITEAFGLVAIEAMKFGCVPLTTNSCGVSEVIENGHTGYVFSIENYVNEAFSIIKTIDNTQFQSISNRCIIEIQQNLTYKKYIDEHIKLLEEAQKEHRNNITDHKPINNKYKSILDSPAIPNGLTFFLREFKSRLK